MKRFCAIMVKRSELRESTELLEAAELDHDIICPTPHIQCDKRAALHGGPFFFY